MGSLDRLWMNLRSLVVPAVAVWSVLLAAGTDKPEEVVLQLYAWERDRLMTLAKGIAGAAVTVGAALIASAIEGKITVSGDYIILAAVFLGELLVWAGAILIGLRRLAEEYPLALGLVQ